MRATPHGPRDNHKMGNKLMTVEEVTDYLRVKDSTVYKWAKDGKIAAAKVGEWVKKQKAHGDRHGRKKGRRAR